MRGPVTPSFTDERAALEAILESERFVRAPRLGRLLRYLCERCFEGRAEQIKEYNIATEVLGRSAAFDPSQDAIARVEAHRLRKKLREYYAAEGSSDRIRIVLSPGTYVPEFVDGRVRPERIELTPALPEASSLDFIPPVVHALHTIKPEVLAHSATLGSFLQKTEPVRGHGRRWLAGAIATLLAMIVAGVWFVAGRRTVATETPSPITVSGGSATLSTTSAIRVMSGAMGGVHIGRLGHTWQPDFYFAGGSTSSAPHDFVARTSDPTLFQNFRTGEFRYDIPLAPGTYELHLYFVETMYGPGLTTGGGENSRTFVVWLNGQVLLNHFDIISDADGPNIADERVFRDVHPGSDGKLHLQFTSERGQPVLSALSILPGIPNHQLPIRIVAQETSVSDHEGHLFEPDSYFIGGQTATHRVNMKGTADSDLFAGERYGNFSYALPVDTRGLYGVKLYLAEEFWGSQADNAHSGVGKRVFNVDCNGVRLIENLDLYRQVGEAHALIKTFHRLRPNAQGKLLLSFEPVENYASVYAIEVLDESR